MRQSYDVYFQLGFIILYYQLNQNMEAKYESFPIHDFLQNTGLKIVTSHIFRWNKNRPKYATTTNQKL